MTKQVLSCFAGALLMACGGSVSVSPDDSGTRDSAVVVDSGAPIDAPDPFFDAGPGACNGVMNVGSVVNEVSVPAPMPRLVGATDIPSGRYVVVKSERYTGAGGASGATGNSLQETIVVTPGIVQAVVSSNGGANEATTTSYSIVGSAMRVSPTCGAGTATAPSVDLSFDVAGSTLRIGVSLAGMNAVLTFQKS